MSRKILIVDDNESERFLITRSLMKIGINIEDILTAVDGEEGYTIIKERDDIEVVLLDINMPKLNGLEVLGLVRNVNETPPPFIVMLTTSKHETDIGNAIAYGADAFSVKENDPSITIDILMAIKVLFIQKAVLPERLRKLFKYVR